MPALLLVVPATAAVSASARIVQAVEECRLEPGWPAPSGSRWLSRINRDHHRCWFVSSKAIGGHHTQSRRAASVRNRHLAGDQHQRHDSDLEAVSPPIGKTAAARRSAGDSANHHAFRWAIVGKSDCAQRSYRSLQGTSDHYSNRLRTADGRRCTYCRPGAGGRKQHHFGSSCRSRRRRSVIRWRNVSLQTANPAEDAHFGRCD